MKESEVKYRKHGGLNNSLLHSYGDGLSALRDYNDPEVRRANKDKPHFRMGLYADVKTLTPEELADSFVTIPNVVTNTSAPILIQEYIKQGNTFWDVDKLNELSLNGTFVLAGKEVNGLWNGTKKTDLRIANFNTPEWRNYFEVMVQCESKTWLTEKETTIVDKAVNILQTHPRTSWLLRSDEESGWEFTTQVDHVMRLELPAPIEDTDGYLASMPERYIVEDGKCVAVWIKGLLDIVRINVEEELIQPIDLKTMGKPTAENFEWKSFLDYGYYTQGALYDMLIKDWAKIHYPNFTVLPFMFVVKSLTCPSEPPIVYKVSDNILSVGLYSGHIGNRKIKGIYELIIGLTKQEATGQYWESPNQFIQSEEEGFITIDLPITVDHDFRTFCMKGIE